MTKKKTVTCSPFMLIMGYEYSQKQDRQTVYDRQKSKLYYALKKKK